MKSLQDRLDESANRYDINVQNLEALGNELHVVIKNLAELKRDVEDMKQSIKALVSGPIKHDFPARIC